MSAYKLKTGKVGEVALNGYKKVEDTVVGGYKKIEDTVVHGYKKIETAFVDAFLEKVESAEALSDEDGKEDNRLTGQQ